ncbi:hypothetical protein CFAM422_000544 [Trichoderma lentiforme]|uniref:Uncharacterized protein n=1 Tax=Trichoderma lentiforme TaxID=1567552 RepID=A0A9P4XR24_9HYPO|nr:hypothetical protein CFAM422_000544 [Trichoderma lentiforme]
MGGNSIYPNAFRIKPPDTGYSVQDCLAHRRVTLISRHDRPPYCTANSVIQHSRGGRHQTLLYSYCSGMNPELTRALARIRGTLMALSPGRVDWRAGAGDGEMRDLSAQSGSRGE